MSTADALEQAAGTLRSVAGKYTGAVGQLNQQSQSLSGVVSALLSGTDSWAGSGSLAFEGAWNRSQGDRHNITSALTSAAGNMTSLASTIDANVAAIRTYEGYQRSAPSMNAATIPQQAQDAFKQAMQNAQQQAASAEFAIAMMVGLMAGQLTEAAQQVGVCSTNDGQKGGNGNINPADDGGTPPEEGTPPEGGTPPEEGTPPEAGTPPEEQKGLAEPLFKLPGWWKNIDTWLDDWLTSGSKAQRMFKWWLFGTMYNTLWSWWYLLQGLSISLPASFVIGGGVSGLLIFVFGDGTFSSYVWGNLIAGGVESLIFGAIYRNETKQAAQQKLATDEKLLADAKKQLNDDRKKYPTDTVLLQRDQQIIDIYQGDVNDDEQTIKDNS